MNWEQFTTGMNAPDKFSVVVTSEVHEVEDKATFSEVEKTVYYAHALEWSIGAQGDTIEEAVESLTRVLFGQAMLQHERPQMALPKASEERWYAAFASDRPFVAPDPEWASLTGFGGVPIVHRCTIDMASCGLRT